MTPTNKLLDLLHDALFTVVCVLAVVCAIAVAVARFWNWECIK